MTLETDLIAELGEGGVVTDSADMARYLSDWAGMWKGTARAVIRPRTTAEVSAALRMAYAAGVAIIPQGGNTGVCGGATGAAGTLILSLDRMSRIERINPLARTAVCEAGATLESVQIAAREHRLTLPIEIGARGSCTIGGVLSTNAGGFNVLRYGPTRALCLGLEAVLPGGQVIDVMSELRKDNTGYALRDLMIGAEGTLGVITRAVMSLTPEPIAHATAFVAVPDLHAAQRLLARAQEESGGMVEAFELMSGHAVAMIRGHFPDIPPPLSQPAEWGILIELAATAERDARPGPDGVTPVSALLEAVLEAALEDGDITDATLPRTEAQRAALWRLRESSLAASSAEGKWIRFDMALPLDRVPGFLEEAETVIRAIAPEARINLISHLGDGNLHYAVKPSPGSWTEETARMIEDKVLDITYAMGGTFSAEHGIGRYKPHVLAVRKDAGALALMRALKATIDPKGLMNPGAVLSEQA